MQVFSFLINGLTLGATYALIAVGYSIVFGILRLINFSHGSVYALGAHIAMVLIGFRIHPVLGVAASILLCGCAGILIDRIALKPLRAKDAAPITSLITTVGLSYVIQNLLQIFFDTQRKPFPNFYYFGQLDVLGVSISSASVIVFLSSCLLLLVMTLIIYHTRLGLAMRAIQQNGRAARLMGINVNQVIMITFFMAGASAAFAGTLMAGYYQTVYSTMGFTIGLKAFSAAILGGIGNLYGAVVGGLIIGVTECFAAGYISGTFRDSFAFIILVLILLIKPSGLFGKKGVDKI